MAKTEVWQSSDCLVESYFRDPRIALVQTGRDPREEKVTQFL